MVWFYFMMQLLCKFIFLERDIARNLMYWKNTSSKIENLGSSMPYIERSSRHFSHLHDLLCKQNMPNFSFCSVINRRARMHSPFLL